MPFVTTWLDLEGVMLSKISQMKKDKQHMISLICGLLKQNKLQQMKMNTQIWRTDWGLRVGEWGQLYGNGW